MGYQNTRHHYTTWLDGGRFFPEHGHDQKQSEKGSESEGSGEEKVVMNPDHQTRPRQGRKFFGDGVMCSRKSRYPWTEAQSLLKYPKALRGNHRPAERCGNSVLCLLSTVLLERSSGSLLVREARRDQAF